LRQSINFLNTSGRGAGPAAEAGTGRVTTENAAAARTAAGNLADLFVTAAIELLLICIPIFMTVSPFLEAR
jgi:hypothetical protein